MNTLPKDAIFVAIYITICVFSLSPLAKTSVTATPLVRTGQGLVRGYATPSAHVYRGIPYARPPVGSLRWQPPQPPAPWGSKVRNATESGPGCPQVNCDLTTPKIACPTQTSEDCLYLDIFAPVGAKNGSNLPVMLFIHGGNFFTMSGSSPLFDGHSIVQRGNVLQVNINYRLGALGFLVTGRGDGAATGNYGILDQRLAFKWVLDNVRGFGGDPQKITLFGQSAGSQSILHHMTSPKSAPYFRSAILESDPISLPYRSFDEALVLGGLLAEKLDCQTGDMKCLRSKSAMEISEAAFATRSEVSTLQLLQMFEPYGPFVDGKEILGQPIDIIKRDGADRTKPMIIGSLSEETVLYIYSAFTSSVSLQVYDGIVALFKPSHAVQILLEYPPTPRVADQREVLVNMSTDYVFTCPTRNVARYMTSQIGTNVWNYVWNHAMSFPGWGPVTFCQGRVCHGSELVFVFDTASAGNFTMTSEEVYLVHDVIEYWTNFVWSGDPNNKGTNPKFTENSPAPITWPQYTVSNKWSSLEFKTPTRNLTRSFQEQQCNFWDSIGYT